MKIKLLTFIFFLISLVGFSQTKEIDSLKAELLKPSLSDTTKIKLYSEITEKYQHISNDSVGKYSDLALNLARLSTKFFLGRAYNNKGMYHLGNRQIDSAQYYFKETIKIGELIKDTLFIANGYANYEVTLSDVTDFEEKVQLGLKAIKLLKNHTFALAESQYNLSVNYGNAGYDSLAIKYLKLAAKNAKESNHDILQSYVLGNLLHFQLRDNKLDEAKSNLDKSLALCKKLESPRVCSHYYLRAGLYYDKLKEFDQAETAYYNALENVKKLNDMYDLMYTYQSIGKHFVLAEKPKQAIDNFMKFENIYKDNPTPDIGVWAYEYWAKAEKMVGNFQKSNEYLEKYVMIKDSINSDKNKTSIANAETKYQSEKKDKELAQQNLQLEQQETELQKKKKENGYITGASLLLLVASILLWFLYQQRQKRKNQEIITLKRERQVQTLESLMEGEEKERMRIAKELHDGVNVDLSAIKYKLTSLLEKNNEVINEAVLMIDKSCEQVRAISHNLIPPSLKNFSLIETLEDFCTTTNSLHKSQILFNHIGEPVDISKKAEVNIFRIVQELVNNSIKHANATEITVQVSHRDNVIQLTVEDNGIGFDKATITSNGIGLKNVQSRVDYLSAKIDFSSTKKGTSYIIDINTNELL